MLDNGTTASPAREVLPLIPVGEGVHPLALKPGDHVFSYRRLFGVYFYSHHGIYEGDGMVIHKTRTHARGTRFLLLPLPSLNILCEKCSVSSEEGPKSAINHGVARICLDCFGRDGCVLRPVYVYAYGVRPWWLRLKRIRGSCTSAAPSRSPEQVVETARTLLSDGGFGQYDLLRNNCEHFATFCTTGERISEQADGCAYLIDKLHWLTRFMLGAE